MFAGSEALVTGRERAVLGAPADPVALAGRRAAHEPGFAVAVRRTGLADHARVVGERPVTTVEVPFGLLAARARVELGIEADPARAVDRADDLALAVAPDVDVAGAAHAVVAAELGARLLAAPDLVGAGAAD